MQIIGALCHPRVARLWAGFAGRAFAVGERLEITKTGPQTVPFFSQITDFLMFFTVLRDTGLILPMPIFLSYHCDVYFLQFILLCYLTQKNKPFSFATIPIPTIDIRTNLIIFLFSGVKENLLENVRTVTH